MTGNPEVISSPVGLVPTNALVLNGPLNSQIVYTEVSLEAAVQTGIWEVCKDSRRVPLDRATRRT